MAGRTAKEKKQIIILGVLFTVILGTVIYMNREKFVPKTGEGGLDLAPVTRERLGTDAMDELFEREDFDLKSFGETLRPDAEGGNPDLFKVPEY